VPALQQQELNKILMIGESSWLVCHGGYSVV